MRLASGTGNPGWSRTRPEWSPKREKGREGYFEIREILSTATSTGACNGKRPKNNNKP